MGVDFQCTDMVWEFKTTGVPWVLLEADLWQGVFEMMQQFEEADFWWIQCSSSRRQFFWGQKIRGRMWGTFVVCSCRFWVRWNCSTFPETIANSLHLKMGGLWKIRRFRTWFHHHHFQVLFMLVSRRVTKKSWPLEGAVLNQLLFAEDLPEANVSSSEASVPVSPNKNGTGTFGGFLKWWVSPTGPWVFLLEMIKTWGVNWGYHHLRKHPFGTFLQTCYEVYSKSIRKVLVGSEPSETGGG